MKKSVKIALICMSFSELMCPVPANAKTVKEKITVTQKPLPNVDVVDFLSFDANHDGTLSMAEVGQKLFYIFDRDGNEVIDNIEFDEKKVMTIIPMEKQVFTYVDYDDDGKTDHKEYDHATFFQQSHLMRFDDEMNGLSPSDFIETGYLELDDNNSKYIEFDEWQEAYLQLTIPRHVEQERYN